MTQAILDFNLSRAESHKVSGMNAAATSRNETLDKAREVAHWLARHGETISADDVIKGMAIYGYTPAQLGNAAGSLFRGKEWEMVGWTPSTRVSNHGRYLRMWRLK